MTDDDQTLKNLELWRRVLLWTPGDQGREKRYGILCVLILGLIWGPSLAYLKFAKPRYTSKWTLILPGTGVNAMVKLDSIGQASTSSTSAYGSNTISPNANYKSIAESSGVLELAAKKMKMDADAFGKPRITLVDQTSMIFFEVQGKTGSEAQKKSYALYEAMESTLNNLREDEIKRREDSVQRMLASVQDKLKQSRDQLLAYQSESKVVAIEQFNQFTTSLEDVKIKLFELKAENSRLMGERDQLTKTLNLTAKQASDALLLQTDPVFQENMKHFAQADAMLGKEILKMGENHPEVVKARNEAVAAKQKLGERIKRLVGNPDPRLLERLTVSSDSTRGALFERMIALDAEAKGSADKIEKLEQQIVEMTARLDKDMNSAATLDDLKRNHQIAEAVFTSALARIDTGKSDIYASYPLIQMLTPPNAPGTPTSPNRLFVFIGAGAATVISLFGMGILWTRKNLLRKILLNA